MTLSSHQSAKAKGDTWLTPPEWIQKLGPFDLDPCCPLTMPWRTATTMLTKNEDGLIAVWAGRVWLNPPFDSRAIGKWVEKLVQHGNGIVLVPARTETKWFYNSVWYMADAILFVKSRPHFHRADGSRAPFNSGVPIALAAYGERNVLSLEASSLGIVVRMQKQ